MAAVALKCITRSCAAAVLMFSMAAFAQPPIRARDESVAVSELRFRDLYRLPVGPRGLEPSPRLLALEGRQVRLLAYMARLDPVDAVPGLLLLTPLPVSLGDEDERYADDLPITTIYAHLDAAHAADVLVYRPGLLAVTGRLELGSAAEADGRRSVVRLRLDETSSAALLQDATRLTPSKP